jgi:HlyD family secretion protein
MRRGVIVLLIVAAIGAGAGAYYLRRGASEIQATTAPVTRGEIIDTVGATGTLQAVTTVQVGSQVSGNIAWLGADFNTIVKKGQVIAKLDPSLFEAQVQQAKASLFRTQADLEHNRVTLTDAQQKYARAQQLSARNLLPQSDLDAAKIAVDAAEAALKSSQAMVEQAEATLHQNQVNLEHTIIVAPIDGIVTQRSVDVGQTVAASLQSPTLFIIAADLTKMQVNANIDEADVGRIRPQQRVTFRVDAYPTETFEGTVSQIRLQPVVVQNVTTYGTVIDVPNPQLKLKPGMTANVRVEIVRRSNVLRVPTAALRFRPTGDIFTALGQEIPPEVQFAGRGGFRQGGSGGGRGSAGGTTPSDASASSSAQPGKESAKGSGSGPEPPGQSDERRARMMERFKTMSPEEQKLFLARMKERGADTSAFEQGLAAQKPSTPAATSAAQPKKGGTTTPQSIDALFAPLQPVETRGRVWLFVERQLKPVSVRLGITDGTNTELLTGDLQEGSEVVTGFTGLNTPRSTTGQTGTGNPLMPQRGFPGGRGR